MLSCVYIVLQTIARFDLYLCVLLIIYCTCTILYVLQVNTPVQLWMSLAQMRQKYLFILLVSPGITYIFQTILYINEFLFPHQSDTWRTCSIKEIALSFQTLDHDIHVQCIFCSYLTITSDMIYWITEPPQPPTLLDPIATSSTSVTLRWEPVTQNWYTSVTNYIAYYKQR